MISFLVLEREEEEDGDPSWYRKHGDQPEDESPRYLADEGSTDERPYSVGRSNNSADDTWNIRRVSTTQRTSGAPADVHLPIYLPLF